MMTLVSLFLSLLAWPSNAEEAYLKTQIYHFDTPSLCSASGRLNGKEVIVICLQNSTLAFLTWGETGLGWHTETMSIPFNATTIAIGDARGDGISRVYVGANNQSAVIEYTPDGPQRWRIDSRNLFGVQSLAILLGTSKVDGKPRLFVHQVLEKNSNWMTSERGKQILNDPYHVPCGTDFNYSLVQCSLAGGDWSCGKGPYVCDGGLAFNPWKDWSQADVILGQTVFIGMPGGWRSAAKFDFFRNLVVSRSSGTFFTDRAEWSITPGLEVKKVAPLNYAFGKPIVGIYGGGVDEVKGAFKSMAVGELAGDGQERLYASDLENVYEFRKAGNSWDIGWSFRFEGTPRVLHIADLRNEGKNRLYVVESSQKGTSVHEMTYFHSRLVTEIVDPKIIGGKRQAWSGGAEKLFGDVIRAEAAKLTHLAVLDPEQNSNVEQETKLKRVLCGGESCTGSAVTADPVSVRFEAEIRENSGEFDITTRAVRVKDGSEIVRVTLNNVSEMKVVEYLAASVNLCAIRWPT